MRCETSFFSLTLYKKYLTRYWPIWAVWLAGWILAIPVNIWNEARWGGTPFGTVRNLANLLSVAPAFIAMAVPIVAVCVFFHLFKGPAANFIGALPCKREGIFASAFLAGYTMLAGPLVAMTVLTLLVEWAVGAVAVAPLLTLLGGCLLLCFFWLSFATLCCVISGSGVAAVCFYTIFNGVIIVMTWLVQNVLMGFLYGFAQFSDRVWTVIMWLTPIVQTAQGDDVLGRELTNVSRMEMLWIYAAVGFLMLLASVGLHHIRKAERAGDLIAFGPIRWIFRISVTLCGGLAFGLMLMAIIFSGRTTLNTGAALAGCCAVAAVISWFGAEMLLQKSFKVFKGHWKGALIGALCFILAICAIDMDWIGFTTRVPRADQVVSTQASITGNADPIAASGLVYDQDNVEALIALHQYLADHQDNIQGEHYCHLNLEYDLGHIRLRRSYNFWYSQNSELAKLLADAQIQGLPDIDLEAVDPSYGYIDLAGDNEKYPDGVWSHLDAVQVKAAWAALLEDYRAGRYRADMPQGTTARNCIQLEWPGRGNRDFDVVFVYPRPGTTSLNRFIDELFDGKYGPLSGWEGTEDGTASEVIIEGEPMELLPPDDPLPSVEVELTEAPVIQQTY